MMTVRRGLEAGPGLIQRTKLLLRWVEIHLFCHPVPLPHESSRPVSLLVAFLLASTVTPLNPLSAHSLSPLSPPSPVIIHNMMF